MPYIDPEIRAALDGPITNLISDIKIDAGPRLAGVLNYVISRIVSESIHPPQAIRVWSYNETAQVVAAFEGAKAEFQRRVVEPVEDAAMAKNGDLPGYAKVGRNVPIPIPVFRNVQV